jgi:hypothetical protein
MSNNQYGTGIGAMFFEDVLSSLNKPSKIRWYINGKLENNMNYIKKYYQINEELKRKLSPTKFKQQKEDEEREILEKRPIDLFTPEEIKILKSDDFTIDSSEKEAKSEDKYLRYSIKKIMDVSDNVTYILFVFDKTKNENIYERRIKVSKRSQHKDTLEFILDKCAYILHSIKEKKLKTLDPYNEEKWDEDDDIPSKQSEERQNPFINNPYYRGYGYPPRRSYNPYYENPVGDEQLPDEDEDEPIMDEDNEDEPIIGEDKYEEGQTVKYINPTSIYHNKVGKYNGSRLKDGNKQHSVKFHDVSKIIWFNDDEAELEIEEDKKSKEWHESQDKYDPVARTSVKNHIDLIMDLKPEHRKILFDKFTLGQLLKLSYDQLRIIILKTVKAESKTRREISKLRGAFEEDEDEDDSTGSPWFRGI